MKLKDKRDVECQTESNSMKELKVQGQQHAQFQNAKDSARNRMKKENECCIKFRNETDPVKTVKKRTSMSMKRKL
jgi:hypothetical protein